MTSEKSSVAEDFVSRLIDTKRPDGSFLIHTIKLVMICNDCKSKGKSSAMECIHYKGFIPGHQDEKRHDDLKLMLRGLEDDFLTEIKGLSSQSNAVPAFSPESITLLASSECIYNKEDSFPEIYLGIDPSGGGKASKYAFVAAVESYKAELVVSYCLLN